VAVQFRNISTATGTDATGEGTIPTGTVAGDLMIAFLCSVGSGTTISSAPSGWTLQEPDPNPADFSLWCYSRLWQSGDPNPTWNFSTVGAWTVDVASYSGVDTTTPVNVDIGEQVAAANSIAVGAITPTADNCMLLAFGAVDASGAARTWTESGAMTERLEQTDNALHRVVAEELLSGGSGVGQTRTLTVTGSTQDIGGFLLAVAPAAAAVESIPPRSIAVLQAVNRAAVI
jgi:hypothetical protein